MTTTPATDLTTTPITSPCDVLLTDATEAECRRVMARRKQLKRTPGTHGEQAAMLGEIDGLLDRWLELRER